MEKYLNSAEAPEFSPKFQSIRLPNITWREIHRSHEKNRKQPELNKYDCYKSRKNRRQTWTQASNQKDARAVS
jgi:hypothetical protein